MAAEHEQHEHDLVAAPRRHRDVGEPGASAATHTAATAARSPPSRRAREATRSSSAVLATSVAIDHRPVGIAEEAVRPPSTAG